MLDGGLAIGDGGGGSAVAKTQGNLSIGEGEGEGEGGHVSAMTAAGEGGSGELGGQVR